jgi:hypothetical protein
LSDKLGEQVDEQAQKRKAQVVETVERDGVRVLVYDNGMERNGVTGHIMKPADGTVITRERATILHRNRQEKQARLLREAIVAETVDKLDVPKHGPAAAVAAAGGILWREIVLSPDAYPRDRMDAWEKLGKYAQVLPSDIRREPETQSAQRTAELNAGAAVIMLKVLDDIKAERQRMQREVVDASATDAE